MTLEVGLYQIPEGELAPGPFAVKRGVLTPGNGCLDLKGALSSIGDRQVRIVALA